MVSVFSVKMLAAVALVLLVSSASEGQLLNKCELRTQLNAALGANVTGNMFGNMTGFMAGNMTGMISGNMTGNVTGNLIARIVCMVERTSRFNTSLITRIQNNQTDLKPSVKPPVQPPQKPVEPPHGKPQGKPEGKPEGKPIGKPEGKPGNNPIGRPGERPSFPRGKRSIPHAPEGKPGGKPGGKPEGKPGESVARPEPVVLPAVPTWTNLFGIFQLSDRVACDSGLNQGLNLCRMNCSALTDDDIRDDIACLKTLLNSAHNMMETTFVECRAVIPSQYFTGCP